MGSNSLITAVADPSDSSIKQELLEQIAGIKSQIKQNEADLNGANNMDESILEFVSFALRYVADLKDNFWGLEHEDRVGCVKLLFPEGFYIDTGGNISHPSLSSIFALAEPAPTKKTFEIDRKSLLVELPGIAPGSVELLASALQA